MSLLFCLCVLSVIFASFAQAKKVIVLGGDGFCGWPTSLYLSDQGHEVRLCCVDCIVWRTSISKNAKEGGWRGPFLGGSVKWEINLNHQPSIRLSLWTTYLDARWI